MHLRHLVVPHILGMISVSEKAASLAAIPDLKCIIHRRQSNRSRLVNSRDIRSDSLSGPSEQEGLTPSLASDIKLRLCINL